MGLEKSQPPVSTPTIQDRLENIETTLQEVKNNLEHLIKIYED